MAVTVIATTVNGQKYFFTNAFACSWKRHSKNPTNAKRAVRNIADIPKKTRAGNPINPAQMAMGQGEFFHAGKILNQPNSNRIEQPQSDHVRRRAPH